MKGKNLILTALIAAAAGIGLILANKSLHASGIVVAAGVLFIAAGVLNIMVFLGARDKDGRARNGVFGTAFGWVASAAAIILGLAMLIFQGTFIGLVSFMMAVLVVVAALFQFFLLVYGSRPTRLSGWFYLVPMAMIGAAVYIYLLKSGEQDHIMLIITGVSFAVFGVATFIEGSVIGNNNRRLRKVSENSENSEHSEHSEHSEDSEHSEKPQNG